MNMEITSVAAGGGRPVRVSMPEIPEPVERSTGRAAEPPVTKKHEERTVQKNEAEMTGGVRRFSFDGEKRIGEAGNAGNEKPGVKESQEAKEKESEYDKLMAQKAMENAKERLRAMRYDAKFGYDEEIDRYTITIMDADEKEVIKEIPSEEIQKMIEHLHTMKGMLMDMGV